MFVSKYFNRVFKTEIRNCKYKKRVSYTPPIFYLPYEQITAQNNLYSYLSTVFFFKT